jgi:Fe-S cluster assembly protein SufD
LNTAFFRDGAFIEIPDGLVLERPIYLLFISTAAGEPSIIQPRNLILAGRESQATIIECYIGASGSYFTNSMTELAAGENSFIDSYKITAEGGFHIGRLQVDQQRDSSFSSNSISLGGPLVRNDLVVALNGEGAQCSLDGLYFAAGREHVDNHTVIDHAKAHCSSREMYKGVLAGKSSAVFNGSIVVRKDAQKTDAKQSNRNLLLSEDAVVNSKPELEIYADDVRCTHGTTIGQIEHDALFYLRSRGIGEEEARDLLTYAFATEILDRIKVAPIRAAVEREMLWRLSAAVKEA